MPTYLYPTYEEMMEVDQVLLARTTQDDPIFDLFPIRETEFAMVSWSQKDNYLGLMQIRGYNGEPPSVRRPGISRYIKQPSAFGEFTSVDELELTTRASGLNANIPIPVQDLVAECQEQLLTRQVNRMSWILWTLLINGVYTILDVKGAVVDKDAYTPQTYTRAVDWSSTTTATPLADFRAVQLLARGASTSFGGQAAAFMNQQTFNYLDSNTNANDLGGRRAAGLSTIEGLDEVNDVQRKNNLPMIRVWDDGYRDDAGAFHNWIPDGKVVVVGQRRNNRMIGEMLLTRNVSNIDNSSRPYLKVVDKGAANDEAPPRRIDVHRGFNGGPAIEYPGSVVVMNVA
jgi:hypothetical protein